MILPVIVICALIFPANFSTAAILFSTSMILMFIGRVSFKYLAGLIGTAIVFIGLLFALSYAFPNPVDKVFTRLPTWKARIEARFNPDVDSRQLIADDNYQSDHAKMALANGGVTGVGPGNSNERNFLPQAYSDFIYAIIVEEYGFIAGVFILMLYMILLFRGIRIVLKGPKSFGTFLVIGCCVSLTFQALINMAVATGLFPVTGQPLPLLSMGGTSLWFTSLAIGVILSVSRTVIKPKAEQVAVS